MFDQSALSSFDQTGQILLKHPELRVVLGVLRAHAPDHEALRSEDPQGLGDVIGGHGGAGEAP